MGFKLIVEGKTVYETDFEADEVSKISIHSGTEGAELGLALGQDQILIELDRRDPNVVTMLDIESSRSARAKATELEEYSKSAVAEGRKQQAEIDSLVKEIDENRSSNDELVPSSSKIGEPSLTDAKAKVDKDREDASKSKTPVSTHTK